MSVVTVEERGPVTIIAINRPEKLNAIVPDGRELDEAIAMARKIIDLAPLALATMKRFVTEHILPQGPSELASRFNAELAAVRNSEDAAEGVRAFKERRKPQYKGR